MQNHDIWWNELAAQKSRRGPWAFFFTVRVGSGPAHRIVALPGLGRAEQEVGALEAGPARYLAWL